MDHFQDLHFLIIIMVFEIFFFYFITDDDISPEELFAQLFGTMALHSMGFGFSIFF